MFIVSVTQRQCVDSLKHLCYLFVARPPNISIPERAMRLCKFCSGLTLVHRHKFCPDRRNMSYHGRYTHQTCFWDMCRPI